MASSSKALSKCSASVHRISNAQSLSSLLSSIGSVLDGVGVDDKSKRKIDKQTKESLAICDTYNKFTFDTVQVYARPIQQIGAHKAADDEKYNKDNATKASYGYHHALIILSGGDPEPLQYVLDRVEGVRFVRVNIVEEELISGHLILVKEYEDIALKYEDVKSFVIQQSLTIYNILNNNCLHFAYNFINNILKINEWSNDFRKFWKFISSHFKLSDIAKGKFNKHRNYFSKLLASKKLAYQNNIRSLDRSEDHFIFQSHAKLPYLKFKI